MEGSTRGLNVALLEGDDFAAGTSGRSTKLIHGGIRYLEQAVFSADVTKLELVIEALAERAHLLNAAPFMAHPVPIMIPLYKWWELPYMYAGAKAYDIFAWSRRAVPASTLILKVSINHARPTDLLQRWHTRALRKAPSMATHDPSCALHSIYAGGRGAWRVFGTFALQVASRNAASRSPHHLYWLLAPRCRRFPLCPCSGRGHVPLPDAQP